jgi:quercetin dioxygenase-like cupin family protein
VDVVRRNQTHQWQSPRNGLSAEWLAGPSQGAALDVALVHFEPGSATPPHIHHGGQTLVGVTGRGFVEIDGQRTEFDVGDIVVTPPGEQHVHGALDDGEFVHLSVTTGRNEIFGDTSGYPTAPSA